ncbi:MAG: hypothetical protein KGL46_13045 [Hyphomicrobiales bacterium]|nr:hypothetical protein [Hyphomicrobiales bacterium]
MDKYRYFLAAIFCTIATVLPVDAQCPVHAGVKIIVDLKFGELRTVFDTNLKDLSALAIATGHEAHMPLRAVYSSDVLSTADIKEHVDRDGAGQFCASASLVQVHLSVQNRTIHVAKEIINESCLLKAATGHAEAHAHDEEVKIAAAETEITSRLKGALSRPLISNEDSDQAQAQLTTFVRKQIELYLNEIEARESESSKMIDSSASLENLRNACARENGIRP